MIFKKNYKQKLPILLLQNKKRKRKIIVIIFFYSIFFFYQQNLKKSNKNYTCDVKNYSLLKKVNYIYYNDNLNNLPYTHRKV